MNYILFGAHARDHLLPFTFIRPVADIRLGILTIREKWEIFLGNKTSTLTQEYLSDKYPLIREEDNVLINGSVIPSKQIVEEIRELDPNQTLVSGDILIAHRVRSEDIDNMDAELLEDVEPMHTKSPVVKLFLLSDLIVLNQGQILADYMLLTAGRKSQPIPDHVRVISPENLFVEEGAKLDLITINASEGPVYIGKNVHIMDGAMLRGPLGVGDSSIVRMGAKIYGGSSIGPFCKVGGEMSSSIIFGYSNKAHDGFLGHSVIGEWCNLGADTNTSNMKNNYDQVRLWDYAEGSFTDTGMMFCGTFMGDHSKCAINTMFNTGTVVGVNAQLFGTGFMRNFIPSFTWGSTSGYTTVHIDKAIDVARRVYARKDKEFTIIDEHILRSVFDHTFGYRKIM